MAPRNLGRPPARAPNAPHPRPAARNAQLAYTTSGSPAPHDGAQHDGGVAVPRDSSPTWKLEILISSAVLFSLFQLPPQLDGALRRWEPHATYGASFVLLMVYSYLKGSVYTLIAGFVVHLAARAYWVGLVGLLSVPLMALIGGVTYGLSVLLFDGRHLRYAVRRRPRPDALHDQHQRPEKTTHALFYIVLLGSTYLVMAEWLARRRARLDRDTR